MSGDLQRDWGFEDEELPGPEESQAETWAANMEPPEAFPGAGEEVSWSESEGELDEEANSVSEGDGGESVNSSPPTSPEPDGHPRRPGARAAPTRQWLAHGVRRSW